MNREGFTIRSPAVRLPSHPTILSLGSRLKGSFGPLFAGHWKDTTGDLSSSVALPVRSDVECGKPSSVSILGHQTLRDTGTSRLEAGTLENCPTLDLFPVLGPFSSLLLPIFSQWENKNPSPLSDDFPSQGLLLANPAWDSGSEEPPTTSPGEMTSQMKSWKRKLAWENSPRQYGALSLLAQNLPEELWDSRTQNHLPESPRPRKIVHT